MNKVSVASEETCPGNHFAIFLGRPVEDCRVDKWLVVGYLKLGHISAKLKRKMG